MRTRNRKTTKSYKSETLQNKVTLKELLDFETKEEGEKLLSLLLNHLKQVRWEYFGGKRNNAGPLEINHNPEYPIAERIMNAIDAIIQAQNASRLLKYSSPQEVAQKELDSEDMTKSPEDLDVKVSFRGAWDNDADSVTLDIRDKGIGLSPNEMKGKILSLHNDGKTNVPYLSGKFGHGGSQTFAFSNGISLIATRAKGSDEVSVAFVFRCRPGDDNQLEGGVQKNISSYITLLDVDDNNEGVPFKFSAYDNNGDEVFEEGTLIRHFEYKLDQRDLTFKKNPTPQKTSFYKTMNQVFPEVILPFSIFDRREGKRGRGTREAVVYGSKRVLDNSNKIEYKNSAPVPIGKGNAKLKIHWYVLDEDSTQEKWGRNFVNHGYSGSIMLSGQNVTDLPSRIVRKKANLPFLEKSVLLFADLDSLDDRTLDDIATSTRQNIKQPYLDQICEFFSQHLEADATLRTIHKRRKANLSRTQNTNKSINNKLKNYFKNHTTGSAAQKRSKRTNQPNGGGRNPQNWKDIKVQTPASFIKIFKKARAVPRGGTFTVPFSTDAKSSLFHNNFSIKAKGPQAQCVDVSKVSVTEDKKRKAQGYKTVVNLNVSPTSSAADNFKLVFELENENGEIIRDEMRCCVYEPSSKNTSSNQTPDFNVHWIEESQDQLIDEYDLKDKHGNLVRDKVGILRSEKNEYNLYLVKFNEEIQQGLDVLENNISTIQNRFDEYKEYFLQDYMAFTLGVVAGSYAIMDEKDATTSLPTEDSTEFEVVLRNSARGAVAFWENNLFKLVQ